VKPTSLFASVLAVLLLFTPAARAEDDMRQGVHDYYAAEVKTSFLFMGYGAVTAGAGAAALTEHGDFSRRDGCSSLKLWGTNALGGAGYGIAAKLRGDYYEDLAVHDPARFKLEEGDRIAGTNSRFWLYLGSEIVETLAGIGIATYGFVSKNDLYRGIGTGTAIQGIGLFVIDVPGAGRASRYQEEIRKFQPSVGFDGRSFAATVGRAF
jgi:hypothetical protein